MREDASEGGAGFVVGDPTEPPPVLPGADALAMVIDCCRTTGAVALDDGVGPLGETGGAATGAAPAGRLGFGGRGLSA